MPYSFTKGGKGSFMCHTAEAHCDTTRPLVTQLWTTGVGKPLAIVASYDMAEVQWIYSISGPFSHLIRHGWDPFDLFYSLSHLIRHAWDTVDLFYPRVLRHLIRPAWDTVDLFYSRSLSHLIRHAWDTVDLFYPRALSHHIRHAWDTVDLFYPRALSLLIRHAWDTVDLFYPRALSHLSWSNIFSKISWSLPLSPSHDHEGQVIQTSDTVNIGCTVGSNW